LLSTIFFLWYTTDLIMKIVTGRGVAYEMGFGLHDWIYCASYVHKVWDYMQYSAIAILHPIQFTITHTLGFSVFCSHILATDLSQPHCNFQLTLEVFFSPPNSFLAISCQSPLTVIS
jgi:hypothetical protein